MIGRRCKRSNVLSRPVLMGRGLDGYLVTYHEGPCAVFKLHRGGCLAKFRWLIAKGRHLFPFRTEQLSLSAPMVLGGQPPGRVGRRRFFFSAVRVGMGPGLRLPMDGAWRPRRPACVALLRGAVRRERAACPSTTSRPGRIPTRTAIWSCFASSRSSPNGLEPVLAKGCEVDREVDGVGQAVY